MKIPRYRIGTYNGMAGSLPDKDGAWCKQEDVEKLEQLVERLVDDHDNAECWNNRGGDGCYKGAGNILCPHAPDWDRVKRKCPHYEDKVLRGYQPLPQEDQTDFCGASSCEKVTKWERTARRTAKKLARLERLTSICLREARHKAETYRQEMNRQYEIRCKKGEIAECPRCLREGEAKLTTKELDLARQWFNYVQDVGPAYLAPEDYLLAAKIHAFLDRRIPDSIAQHLPGGETT